jgi:hypothetical protein
MIKGSVFGRIGESANERAVVKCAWLSETPEWREYDLEMGLQTGTAADDLQGTPRMEGLRTG